MKDSINNLTREIQQILNGRHPTQMIASVVHHLYGEMAKAGPYLEEVENVGLRVPD
ncbi:hypothetical protein N9Z74_00310 [bacterium]|nr:hypothetical protein [Akkermansiaceae bacterium]MDB4393378.1 hypothetical protein [bacterium]MDB4464654.1 hypothetical protein [Akkermansiaceae bacterium]